MNIYINGIGNISPQNTYEPEKFLTENFNKDGNRLNCIEPAYEDFIDPRMLRRMSRIIRMGWTAAKICLTDAGIDVPDAIITGTGMGCIEDTEKFLQAIFDNEERFLPPTPFIQSTHNTIGAQIALMLQCTNYNVTYTQRGIAFENAVIDALSLLHEPGFKNVLVGGFDEMTDNQVAIYNRLNYYKQKIEGNLKLLNRIDSGTIAGEGTAFFMLSPEKTNTSYAIIKDIESFNYPACNEVVLQKILNFLGKNLIKASDIDLLLCGFNGDIKLDIIYNEVVGNLFAQTGVGYFKHLCGEYHAASAFGLWLAANILKRQFVPNVVKLHKVKFNNLKNILIYNHYRNTNHSLILLSSG